MVSYRRRRGIETRLPGSGRLSPRPVWDWLVADSGLHHDFVNLGRDVLGQVVEQNVIDVGRGSARMEHRLPLNEARRRDFQFRVPGKIDMRPRAPVAVRIVHVAAARVEFDVAGSAHATAPPARKDVGIENVAFVGSFRLGTGTKHENLAQVAAGNVKTSAGCGGKCGDLAAARFYEVGEIIDTVDGKDVAAIAGSSEQGATLIEAKSVDQIVVRTP